MREGVLLFTSKLQHDLNELREDVVLKQLNVTAIPEMKKKKCMSAVVQAKLVITQIKHQLDATLCRLYFCRVTLHVSGVKHPSSGVLKKLAQRPLVQVL